MKLLPVEPLCSYNSSVGSSIAIGIHSQMHACIRTHARTHYTQRDEIISLSFLRK